MQRPSTRDRGDLCFDGWRVQTGVMRVMAIDLGSRRIGVAVSDPTGTLASPLEVLLRSGEVDKDHRRLKDLVVESGAERVVVGLPLSLDGSTGPAAERVIAEVTGLAEVLGVPTETFDERLTTVTAHQLLAERGVRAKDRREVVDKAAAAVILQTWLESPARAAAEGSAGHVTEKNPTGNPTGDATGNPTGDAKGGDVAGSSPGV